MKLKFQIKKNNQVVNQSIFDSMELGDIWVAQNAAAFGRPDLSLKLFELVQYGFTPEQAASTSQDENNETIYHFPKDWSVEVVDVTAEVEKQIKILDRTKDRTFCLGIIDEIAAINEDLNDPQLMAAILSNPNFTAIILMLLTGGLKTARALMAQHGPSLYPQATVDAFVAKMDAQIASQQ